MKIDEIVRVESLDLNQIKGEFRRVLHYMAQNLSFKENFNCTQVEITFSTPNEDVIVEHGLGRIPVWYLWTFDSQGYVYDAPSGRDAWTTTQMTLRASAMGVATLLVF